MALDCIRSTLCTGTMAIENWCELEEEIKWGKPTYTFNKGIVVMIQAFKDHFDLGFFKGALLQDKAGILNKAGENTQAARQMRFTDIKEIEKRSKIIKSYIKEAITVENVPVLKKSINQEKLSCYLVFL